MNKITTSILLISISFLVLSCMAQRQLTRAFYGKPVAYLNEKFGDPKAVFDSEEGKLYVYEKEEELESTEINQARLTLDPIVTPRVKKTETYYFTVVDGKVIGSKLETAYER